MQDGAMVPSCLRFPSLYSERGGRSCIPAELSDRKNHSHVEATALLQQKPPNPRVASLVDLDYEAVMCHVWVISGKAACTSEGR
jgi:hypothetical protein